MAIDIKAILGDNKYTVMTPAEIANLGLRRKAVKMQQENLVFNRQDSLLSSLEKFATNADTASEFNQLNSELNTISGQIDDPILKAKFGLISSYTNEEHNKYKDFQTFPEISRNFLVTPKFFWPETCVQAPILVNLSSNNALAAQVGHGENSVEIAFFENLQNCEL